MSLSQLAVRLLRLDENLRDLNGLLLVKGNKDKAIPAHDLAVSPLPPFTLNIPLYLSALCIILPSI